MKDNISLRHSDCALSVNTAEMGKESHHFLSIFCVPCSRFQDLFTNVMLINPSSHRKAQNVVSYDQHTLHYNVDVCNPGPNLSMLS